jgi:hypothetical protein
MEVDATEGSSHRCRAGACNARSGVFYRASRPSLDDELGLQRQRLRVWSSRVCWKRGHGMRTVSAKAAPQAVREVWPSFPASSAATSRALLSTTLRETVHRISNGADSAHSHCLTSSLEALHAQRGGDCRCPPAPRASFGSHGPVPRGPSPSFLSPPFHYHTRIRVRLVWLVRMTA